MMTVNEISKLTGISVRTMHYYDEIGLLKPKQITEAGYRLYDDESIERLQDIMLLKELEFSLGDIKRIIDSPSFDRQKALDNQIKLLELKKEHLEGIIVFAKNLKKGAKTMNFKPFDNEKLEHYKEMARQAWGNTEAFKEYEEKTKDYSDAEHRQKSEDMMKIFFEFGDMKSLDPSDKLVQAQVKKLQDFITENYYKCTNEILAGLGTIYKAGGDMTLNIDAAGGKGCAEFVSKAIKVYCEQ